MYWTYIIVFTCAMCAGRAYVCSPRIPAGMAAVGGVPSLTYELEVRRPPRILRVSAQVVRASASAAASRSNRSVAEQTVTCETDSAASFRWALNARFLDARAPGDQRVQIVSSASMSCRRAFAFAASKTRHYTSTDVRINYGV